MSYSPLMLQLTLKASISKDFSPLFLLLYNSPNSNFVLCSMTLKWTQTLFSFIRIHARIFNNYRIHFKDIWTIMFVALLPKRLSIWRRVSSDCMQRSFNKASNSSAGILVMTLRAPQSGDVHSTLDPSAAVNCVGCQRSRISWDIS